jgi:low temperature requirement protein LtrA
VSESSLGTSPRSPEGLRRARARDPHERHRVATPLELLYDLTFAVAFGQAGGLFAHEVMQGHLATGTKGYLIASFAILWAWTNFTWYASAFDPDDWLHRLLTTVQMIGVVVLALGMAPFFHSLTEPHPDNALMVAGYVVMRVAMVAQWARVAAQDPAHRPVALKFAGYILLVQLLWVVLLVAQTSWTAFVVGAAAAMVVEVGTPVLLERRYGTPWHPHHLAERYSLLAIITLGEGRHRHGRRPGQRPSKSMAAGHGTPSSSLSPASS